MYIQLIADALSIITIASCFTLKVPQIKKLMNMKTATGISISSLLLELTSYTVMTCYNYTNGYSIFSYMEYPVILAQEYVLIFLVLKYLDLLNKQSFIFAILYYILSTCLFFELLPKNVLTFMVPICTPISASSKVIQLFAILRAKNADSVSPMTWFISAFTNFTRVFTVWVDSADSLLLLNFIISTALSTSIMLTSMYYKKHTKSE